MKRRKSTLLCTTALLATLAAIHSGFVTPVAGEEIFSPTLAEMECKKIADRDERNSCRANVEAKKERVELNDQLTDPLQKEPEYNEENCSQFTDAKKRALCFSEYHKQQQQQKQQKLERESTAKKKKREPEPVLKIIPCEKKTDPLEKAVCYNEFHQEQQEKAQQRKAEKHNRKQAKIIEESPTLRELRCKKIADRNERNDCFSRLHEEERERKRTERQAEIENFDYDEELRRCLDTHNDHAREECFDELSKKTHRIFNAQDRQFDPTAND